MGISPEVAVRVDMFVEKLQELYDAEFAAKFPFLKSPLITVDGSGRKYIRVVTVERYPDKDTVGSTSVYCFINAENGDILKADGWKKPAVGKRGSIFNDNCDVGVKATVYGSGLYR